MRDMNIILVGYRCSGKSAVGKMLANRLDKDFIDTDALIEETEGSSIESMVEQKGWDYFRKVEKKIVGDVSSESSSLSLSSESDMAAISSVQLMRWRAEI